MVDWDDCQFVASLRQILPDDFYSTTNFDTLVKVNGEWFPVTNQKMDSVIIWEEGCAIDKKNQRSQERETGLPWAERAFG